MTAGAVALSLLGSSPDALAAEATDRLRIDCDMLGALDRSALEARARAELASRDAAEGKSTIACADRSATVTWQPALGDRRVEQVSLEGDANTAIETILAALHTLASAHAAPIDTTARRATPSEARGEPDVPGREDQARSKAPSPGVAGGFDAELWHGAIASAAGVHAGARISSTDKASAAVEGGVAWGLGSAQGLNARAYRAQLRAEYAVLAHVRLGLGTEVRLLTVDGTGAGGSAPHQTGISGGLLASMRYTVSVAALTFSVGPEIEALARPVVVDVGGSEAFRLPWLLASLALDAELEP